MHEASRGEMYIDHDHLCVCLSVPRHIPTLLHNPDVTWGNGRGCPLIVHYWEDLQSVHGFRYYDNTHVYKLTSLYSANVYSTEHERTVSALWLVYSGGDPSQLTDLLVLFLSVGAKILPES